MDLGTRISQYRKALGLSQEALGDRLGISRQAVSKWETNAATPDMENLLALSREFGVPLSALTGTPESTAAGDTGTPPPRRRIWRWILAAVCLVILALAALLLFFCIRQNTGQTSSLPESSQPDSDFALYWTQSDGSTAWLGLGAQRDVYPFGTNLPPEDSLAEVTPYGNSASLYTVDCSASDGIRITYVHATNGEPDTILLLETTDQDVTTPRGIHVGSARADLIGAYNGDLVYCVKEDSADSLTQYDCAYAYQPGQTGSESICFFMKDGAVSGIRMEDFPENDGASYAVNQITRFPIRQNGDPDYSHRQDLYQDPMDDTRRIYIAWNQLVTTEDLTAEERFACRSQVFGCLPWMDWTAFGALGGTDASTTIMAFINWLMNQDSYAPNEIYGIQRGCMAAGLDGAYAEGYDGVLTAALRAAPVTFAQELAMESGADEEALKYHILCAVASGMAAYPMNLQDVLQTLDAAIDGHTLTAKETGWARLLRYYLAHPSDEGYADYPSTPSELPDA